MSNNPIKLAQKTVQPKRSAQEWCDIGNARLRGEIPYDKDGQYHPRHDIYWFVENGSPKLGWKQT